MHLDLATDAPPLPATGRQAVLKTLDDLLGRLIEIPAALLVVAEVVVLLGGVVSRYVFHAPIVWSDELASILFLWLAMLGAVVAYRRGEHMRMTALVSLASPRTRAFLDAVSLTAGLVFVTLLLHPAYEFAAEEIFVQTPALEITNAWRAAALPVGFGLMFVISILRLLESGDWRVAAAALVVAALVAVALILLEPVLRTLGNWNLLLFFVIGVGALVFSGVPIAFAFGLATFAYLVFTTRAPSMVVVGGWTRG